MVNNMAIISLFSTLPAIVSFFLDFHETMFFKTVRAKLIQFRDPHTSIKLIIGAFDISFHDNMTFLLDTLLFSQLEIVC